MGGANINPLSDFKPRPGTFLPLLEYAQRDKASTQSAPGSPLTLLAILARQAQQSLPMFDLETLSSMQPSAYAKGLKSLRDADILRSWAKSSRTGVSADRHWRGSSTGRTASLNHVWELA